jgi:hypothetical protein
MTGGTHARSTIARNVLPDPRKGHAGGLGRVTHFSVTTSARPAPELLPKLFGVKKAAEMLDPTGAFCNQGIGGSNPAAGRSPQPPVVLKFSIDGHPKQARHLMTTHAGSRHAWRGPPAWIAYSTDSPLDLQIGNARVPRDLQELICESQQMLPGFSNSAAEVAAGIDLACRSAVVTGASSGMVFETPRACGLPRACTSAPYSGLCSMGELCTCRKSSARAVAFEQMAVKRTLSWARVPCPRCSAKPQVRGCHAAPQG